MVKYHNITILEMTTCVYGMQVYKTMQVFKIVSPLPTNSLIQHHLHSTDPTFYDEGLAIQMMSAGHSSLATAATALDQPFADQLFYLVQKGNPELAMATWKDFTPVLVTTRQATLFALSIGIIGCLLAWLIVNLTSMLVRR